MNYLKEFLCFEKDDKFYIDLDLKIIIDPVKSAGFKIEIADNLGLGSERTYFVPCYNCQNGYYSDELKLQITKDNKKIQELDITENTIYQYD